jgi:hypothetical protein
MANVIEKRRYEFMLLLYLYVQTGPSTFQKKGWWQEMRRVLLSVGLCLLMSGIFNMNVVADDPTHHIVGIVSDEGTGNPAPYTYVSFENYRTHEVKYVETDENGYYDFNVDSFNDGWLTEDWILIQPAASASYTSYRPMILTEEGTFSWTKWVDVTRYDTDDTYVSIPFSMSVDSRRQIANNGNIIEKLSDYEEVDVLPSTYSGNVKIWAGYSCFDNAQGLDPNMNYYDIDIDVQLKVYVSIGYLQWSQIGHDIEPTMSYRTRNGADPIQRDPAACVEIDKATYDGDLLWLWSRLDFNMWDSNSPPNLVASWYAESDIYNVRYDWG